MSFIRCDAGVLSSNNLKCCVFRGSHSSILRGNYDRRRAVETIFVF